MTRRAFVVQLAGAGLVAGSMLAGCTKQSGSGESASGDVFSDVPDDQRGSDSEESVSGGGADPEASDQHVARIVLISDTHIDSEFEVSVGHAQAAFAAIAQFDPAPDAIVLNGDITNHGQSEEYDLAEELAIQAGMQFPGSFACAMGNHEQRGYYDEATPEAFQAQRDLFLDRCGLERLYYDKDVNGVHLIILGPDADPQAWRTIRLSDEQLNWLDEKLAADAAAGRTSFVFSHQPIDETVIHTYEGEYANGALESSDALRKVVSGFGNAVVVTAHTHSPTDFYRPDDRGPLYVADSAVAYLRHDPYLDWTDEGVYYSCGVLADVYGNRIEFLAWDFVANAEDEAGGYTLE